MILLNLAVTLMRMVIYVLVSQLSSYRLFYQLNRAITYSKIKFYDQTPVGQILSRLSTDTYTIDFMLCWQIHVMLESAAHVSGYVFGVIVNYPLMSLILTL